MGSSLSLDLDSEFVNFTRNNSSSFQGRMFLSFEEKPSLPIINYGNNYGNIHIHNSNILRYFRRIRHGTVKLEPVLPQANTFII